MGYKVKNLIASKPGLAKVTDKELQYQVFTFLKNKKTCETLIWTPVLEKQEGEEGNVQKNSYLASYTLHGKQVDKIFVSKYAEFTALHDIDINNSQGFVINTEEEKAAGSIFLAASEEGSWLYGYNKLLSKIGFKNYNPKIEEDWVTGFDIFDKYIYTVNDGDRGVTVYDFNFTKITEGFPFPENIPNNYFNVNIKVIDNLVYVVYSRLGKGGIVNVYTLDGIFVRTIINDPELISPWGIVKAPKHFGVFGCCYLIGSGDGFDGDGTINAYDRNGKFIGKLKDKEDNIIVIENLKSLKFLDNKLYFSSGNLAARDNDNETAVIGYIRSSGKCRC